jgi:hypothetical protein
MAYQMGCGKFIRQDLLVPTATEPRQRLAGRSGDPTVAQCIS